MRIVEDVEIGFERRRSVLVEAKLVGIHLDYKNSVGVVVFEQSMCRLGTAVVR